MCKPSVYQSSRLVGAAFLFAAAACVFADESADKPSQTLNDLETSSENASRASDLIIPELVTNPHKVLGYDSCAKCHAQEVNTWHVTRHAQTFDDLHRKPEAKEIARKLGLRSVKREGVCVQCHYTEQFDGEAIKPISGISCESCHGPAADWIAKHNDYASFGTAAAEFVEHRTARRQTSIEAGMRNPANIYLIARSCYNCHTAPQERLVNLGGHKPGSADFELVAWSQGSVAHNFLRSQGSNAPSGVQRLRVMYVVGLLTDLEYSLRATAAATEDGRYGREAARRTARNRRTLAELQLRLRHPLLQQALDVFEGVELTTYNAKALTQTADGISSVALRFADQESGASLQAVDDYLPPPSSYKR